MTVPHSLSSSMLMELPTEEALRRMNRLQARDLYVRLLRECCNSASDCLRLFEHISSAGFGAHRYLGNLLVQSLAWYGNLAEAQAAFDAIQFADVVSWTILIVAYSQNGDNIQAFGLLSWMQLEGVKPNAVTLLACSSTISSLSQTQQLREYATMMGAAGDCRVGNALVCLFGRLGSMHDANNVFDGMLDRDIATWTSLMQAYSHNGHARQSIKLFKRMCLEGVLPDAVCFVMLIDACAAACDGAYGELIFSFAMNEYNVGKHVQLRNTMIKMYGNCGMMKAAREIFDANQPLGDVVSWNSIMAAYVQNGQHHETLELYRRMQHEGMKPTNITFATVTNAASDVAVSTFISDCICEQGLMNDAILRSSIVCLYGRHGNLDKARELLDSHQLDVDTCSSMVAAYAQNQRPHDALRMFAVMALHGIKPRKMIFLTLFDACSIIGEVHLANVTRAMAEEVGLNEDQVEVGNALVNMFGKCGDASAAQDVFDNMQERDEVTWATMMGIYACKGHARKAMRLFRQMQLDGITPNVVAFLAVLEACSETGDLRLGRAIHSYIRQSGLENVITVANSVLSMYVRCEPAVDEAMSMLSSMPEKNLVSWNTVMFAYAQAGKGPDALRLLSYIDLEGMRPDRITLTGVLKANSSTTTSIQHILERVLTSGHGSDGVLGSLLIRKCNNVASAKQLFDVLGYPSGETMFWNSMLSTYAHRGHVTELIGLFHEMLLAGLEPDVKTFSSILFALSHAGMQDDAGNVFSSMKPDHGVEVTEEHYTCILDLLGRKGRLGEAWCLIQSMPFSPSIVTCRTFLSACSTEGDLLHARMVAQLMLELDPWNAATYVLISNKQLMLARPGPS